MTHYDSTLGSNTEKYWDRIKIWFNDHDSFVTLIITLSIFIIIKIIILWLLIGLFGALGRTIDQRNIEIQTGDVLIDLLGTRWDTLFYMTVAQNGMYADKFGYLPMNDTRIWNFGPLYPCLIRLMMDVGEFFGIQLHVTFAGVLIANLFSIIEVVAFFFMSKLYINNNRLASSATLLFAFFPTVFVFSTVAYAEAIYITFTILSWYFFEKKRNLISGVTLGLASLARFPGALVFFLYIPIYIARRAKEEGLRKALGSLIAIPFFPILVTINLVKKIWKRFDYSGLEKIINNDQKHNIYEIMEFLDTGLSWILIFGLLPLSWILFANTIAPMSLAEITYANWGAKFVFPFAGFIQMLSNGQVKWVLEKYIFVVFFLGVGILSLTKRSRFSLLIIGQTLFYTGYTGVHAWGVPRYTGTIFMGPLILAEEINSLKISILIMSLFLTYTFIILWLFINWNSWLI